MGKSKLQVQDSARSLHREADSVLDRQTAGPGNQALLSQLGSARSMPQPVQAKMEESLHADFSNVRLYESPLIGDNGAQAVASGNNVAFAPGMMDFTSSAGLGLLGHELSHVASQARGEVSGSGLINNPALEHQADLDGARAASAFDSLSGQTLSPMGMGAAPASAAGPVQAKKKKEETTGEKLTRGFNKIAPENRIRALMDMQRFSSGGGFDDSQEMAFSDIIAANSTPEMWLALNQQRLSTAASVNDYYDQSIGSVMGDSKVDLRENSLMHQDAMMDAHFSNDAEDLLALGQLQTEMGINDQTGDVADTMMAWGKTDEYRQNRDMLKKSMDILNYDGKNTQWGQMSRDMSTMNNWDRYKQRNDREHQDFMDNYKIPGSEPEKKKKGFFARLFGR